MPDHGLTAAQLNIIRNILRPYADRITRVGLFGSRATGTARPSSDIDMVLYGKIDEPVLDRLRTLFDDSNLALKVDVHAYELVSYPPLKTHIDQVMQCLMTPHDLQ